MSSRLLLPLRVLFRERPEFPIGLVFIAIAAIPATLLHELGHAVTARRLIGGDVQVGGWRARLADI
jgi:hypothetical protein